MIPIKTAKSKGQEVASLEAMLFPCLCGTEVFITFPYLRYWLFTRRNKPYLWFGVRILMYSHVNTLVTSPWSHLAWRESQLAGLVGVGGDLSYWFCTSWFRFLLSLYFQSTGDHICALGQHGVIGKIPNNVCFESTYLLSICCDIAFSLRKILFII